MNEAVPTPLLRHFFNISRHLAGHLDFASAIRAVADEIALFLPYDHMDVCMVQTDGTITGAYESGIETAWAHTPSTPLHSSPIRSLLRGEVDFLLADDAVTDPRFSFPGAINRPILDHGLRSRVHVPLTVDGDLIGALSISRLRAGEFTMREVRHARYVADLLSPYFHAIRAAEMARQSAMTEALARRREEALRIGALELTQLLEHERQRIGMDLHDQTLADLTRLMRDIRAGGEAAQTPALLARLQDCVEELRRIIDMAAPTILELFGLGPALRIHLERAIGDAPVAVSVTDTAGALADALPATTRVALFRITQEAINNAARHSGARRIAVELTHEPGDVLRLAVIDDGHGLPGDTLLEAAKGGIAHMRTRARLIAAAISLRAGQDGTRVEVRLPLSPADGRLSAPAVPTGQPQPSIPETLA